jgi:hypothetical protein
MTSRRRFQTTAQVLRFLTLGVVVTWLAACSALPEDAPVLEKLDTDTGNTVAGIGRPIELYREASKQPSTERFAFLAPFETNQMGARKSYLWIAVPIDRAVTASAKPPVVEVDGAALVLGDAGRDSLFASLSQSPYKLPTPWSSVYYFTLDAAHDLAIRMQDANGEALFVVKLGGDVRLSTYAARP